jgi:hypothetical protein
MSVVKDVCIEIIERMPENATVEDIAEEIFFMGDIYESLKPEEMLTIKTEGLIRLYLQKKKSL